MTKKHSVISIMKLLCCTVLERDRARQHCLTGSLLDRLQAHRSTSLQGESLRP